MHTALAGLVQLGTVAQREPPPPPTVELVMSPLQPAISAAEVDRPPEPDVPAVPELVLTEPASPSSAELSRTTTEPVETAGPVQPERAEVAALPDPELYEPISVAPPIAGRRPAPPPLIRHLNARREAHRATPAAAETRPVDPSPARPEAAPLPLTRVAATGPIGAAIDRSWSAAVAGWIATHKRYPDEARQDGQEGAVGVVFTVARDGRVQGVTIERPSGLPALDRSVREMLRGQYVPPFPATMTEAQTDVRVTVHFQLDR